MDASTPQGPRAGGQTAAKAALTAEATQEAARQRAVWRWALFGLVFNVALTLIKWLAYLITLSAVILTDAIESLVNVLSASFVLYAVWLSHQPRDSDHPYGHGKVEYFSAGFEGALVLGAAGSIVAVSLSRLIQPVQPQSLEVGAAMSLGFALVTLVVGQRLLQAGRQHRSLSLEADGLHVRADAITSFGSCVAVLAVLWTGQLWLDAALPLVAALWLGVSGARVVRRAVGGLMDEADAALLGQIAAALEAAREPGWLSPHHVKVHRLGPALHIDMHMVFPAYWTIERVHQCSQRVEAALIQAFGPLTEVMVHMESCTPTSCAYCDVEGCPIRQLAFEGRSPWDEAQIRAPHRASKPSPQAPDE